MDTQEKSVLILREHDRINRQNDQIPFACDHILIAENVSALEFISASWIDQLWDGSEIVLIVARYYFNFSRFFEIRLP